MLDQDVLNEFCKQFSLKSLPSLTDSLLLDLICVYNAHATYQDLFAPTQRSNLNMSLIKALIGLKSDLYGDAECNFVFSVKRVLND